MSARRPNEPADVVFPRLPPDVPPPEPEADTPAPRLGIALVVLTVLATAAALYGLACTAGAL